MKSLWKTILDGLTYKDLAGKRQPRIYTVVTGLILLLLVPVVSELIRQIGPLYLASRPRYDDLMDGFTFGVVAGVGFACFETLLADLARRVPPPGRHHAE